MNPDDLKTWRQARSLTQKQLGGLLGVSNICVYRWETGARAMPPFLHLALECLELKGAMLSKARGRKEKGKGGEK